MPQIKIFFKFVCIIILLFSVSNVNAQVGINTTTPTSTLDISAPRNGGGGIDLTQIIGMQAPRLHRAELTALTSTYGVNQKGVILYVTDVLGGDTLGQRANVDAPGYYYFDGSLWQKMSTGDKTDDEWINEPANSRILLGAKSDGTARDANTDFVAQDNGQVAIGTNAPEASALFDVSASNKGVIFPRVALVSNTDQTTILNPATGLLAYNTGSAGLGYVGYVYWNGEEWLTLSNSPTSNGTIENLNCSNANMSPATYTTSVAYNGILIIPYRGGNGGVYDAQTIGPINGLTITLSAGNFNVGNGDIVYAVSGTPTVTSPTFTTFNINIGGQSCTAIVGRGERGEIEEYAQVSFESWGSAVAGTAAIGTLATIDPGSKNVARVKRLNTSVFRIDFEVPFKDTSYVVSGYCFEPGAYNANNTQPYLYIPNYTRISGAALGATIMADTDVDPSPTNPSYNLETRQTVVKPDGYNSVVAKYKTHFYIVEGYGNYPLTGASLSATR